MGQKKQLKQLNKILWQIRSYQEYMQSLTDEELAGLTAVFKERLTGGETLDDILPEAFAAICEADYRILGMAPFDVQVLGGIALHQGYLAEMNTGEGKTLVATMPLYLNALTGKSTILLTTNEYLAIRDSQEMGPVFRFMGLTVSCGVNANKEERLENEEKKAVYAADIAYLTHGVFGFDYLLNNLVTTAEDRFMRELYYVIIDEADAVLLDGCQTPLVISGSPRVQSNLYELADFFVTTLQEDRDYETEEKKVWLTDEGVRYAETFFRIDNFYGEEHFEINRHVTLALRAHVLFKVEKDYMISKAGELQLLDGGSGRMMPGVKLRGGQHQALECKEKVEVSQENRSVASITYQNLFLLFPKMAGMSGTIADAKDELMDVYGSKVVVIPPNCPVQRRDMKDLYFKNKEEQIKAAIFNAAVAHSTGQPVLIVVSTIAESELVSKLLMQQKIPHNVLNANNAFWEADIIKEAGQMYAMTVSTGMAGRGTDIRLGEGVNELGGLAVIGIGRMGNIRQERQARGRAGRQGDPGSSQFYVSIQDEVVVGSGIKNIEKYADGSKRLSKRKMIKLINGSQKIGEEFAVMSRKHAMEYDQVMQRQRKLMYATRDKLLDGGTLEKEKIIAIADSNIEEHLLNIEEVLDKQKICRYLLDNISYGLDEQVNRLDYLNSQQVKEYLLERVNQGLEEQKEKLGDNEIYEDFLRIATLSAIDEAWVEQVDYLQQLQSAVSGRSTAQRNPVFEYQQEALESFKTMEKTILKNVIRNILLSNVYLDAEQKIRVLLP